MRQLNLLRCPLVLSFRLYITPRKIMLDTRVAKGKMEDGGARGEAKEWEAR